MKFEGTYKECGHEGTIDVIGGKSAEKEKKAEWYFSGLCPECYKKKKEEERARKNASATKEAEEIELPELTGTPKQVAWANTIRVEIYKVLSKRIGDCINAMQREGSDTFNTITIQELTMAFDWFMQSRIEARFWIDRREKEIKPIEIIKEFRIYNEKETMEVEGDEVIIRPEIATKDGVAKIKAGEKISVSYAKDDDFRDVVKKLGYRWDGRAWYKDITEYTGTREERAAELGNALLVAGFTVQFQSKEISAKAVAGDFTQENDRWVKYNAGDMLLLTWKKRSDVLYEAAKKLPGARWRDGAIRVKVEYYRDIEDFANTMGFNISESARKAIVEQQEKESNYVTTKVEATGEVIKERLEESLKSGGVILEDLKDE